MPSDAKPISYEIHTATFCTKTNNVHPVLVGRPFDLWPSEHHFPTLSSRLGIVTPDSGLCHNIHPTHCLFVPERLVDKMNELLLVVIVPLQQKIIGSPATFYFIFAIVPIVTRMETARVGNQDRSIAKN
ncbi:hypothetical protein V8B97DRAFT_1914181 [Scleroderma yunnanense]